MIDVGDCPWVALLDPEDPDFVAARRARNYRGRPAGDAESVRSALEVAVRRYAELSSSASGRPARERDPAPRDDRAAKGILMERHGISDEEAFEMLRTEARSNNRRVYDVASDVS